MIPHREPAVDELQMLILISACLFLFCFQILESIMGCGEWPLAGSPVLLLAEEAAVLLRGQNVMVEQ